MTVTRNYLLAVLARIFHDPRKDVVSIDG